MKEGEEGRSREPKTGPDFLTFFGSNPLKSLNSKNK